MVNYSEEQSTFIADDRQSNKLLIACAGSGKTTTLSAWITRMIREKRVLPSQILCATFTHEAGREMAARIHSMLKEQQVEIKERLLCNTWHALALFLLLEHKVIALSDELIHLSQMLSMFLTFLRDVSNPKAVAFRQQIKILTVDEYQDEDPVQEAIIEELHRSGTQIVVVGDDNQEIYGFRNSSIEYIRTFAARFYPCDTFYLSTNYRSTAPIVAMANAIIKRNRTWIPKPESLSSSRDTDTNAPLPIILNYQTQWEAGDDVAKRIRQLLQSKPDLPPHEVCVQSRGKALLYDLQSHLMREGVNTFMLCERGSRHTRTKEQTTALTRNRVVLSTIHGVKGLEYTYVFILGLDADFFPDSREPDIERERRLFYVAVTRAKRHLYLVNCFPKTSLFIYEMPPHLYRSGHPAYPYVPPKPTKQLHCSVRLSDYPPRSDQLVDLREFDYPEDEGEGEDEQQEDSPRRPRAVVSGAGDEVDDRKRNAQYKRFLNSVTLRLPVTELLSSLDGEHYDHLKNNLLPKAVPWKICYTIPAPKTEEQQQEEQIQIPRDRVWSDPVMVDARHIDLRADYDAMNIRLPFGHSDFVVTHMLEGNITDFLEVISARMIQEIEYRARVAEGETDATGDRTIEGFYADDHMLQCLANASNRKYHHAIPEECRARMSRHYRKFQNAAYRWDQVLLAAFWIGTCRRVCVGRRAILYCPITEEHLREYVPMLREMYHQFTLYGGVRQHPWMTSQPIDLYMPFTQLVRWNLRRTHMHSEARIKQMLKEVHIGKKRILLTGGVLALSHQRMILCCHQAVSMSNMEQLLEQLDPTAVNNNQSQFPVEPVMEALTLLAMLALQNDGDSPEVPRQLIVYHTFARQVCLIDATQLTRHKAWVGYMCLEYCIKKDRARQLRLQREI